MKTATIRRIIGITALTLCVTAILCRILLGSEDHLAFQADVKMRHVGGILLVVYVLIWIIYAVKKVHWVLKLLVILSTVLLLLYVAVVLSFAGLLDSDSKVWDNGQYAVYHESNYLIDPGRFVMYKRDGIVEERCFALGSGFSNPDSIDYIFHQELGIIQEEADWTTPNDSWHTTCYYDMSTGKPYRQDENDSIEQQIISIQQ